MPTLKEELDTYAVRRNQLVDALTAIEDSGKTADYATQTDQMRAELFKLEAVMSDLQVQILQSMRPTYSDSALSTLVSDLGAIDNDSTLDSKYNAVTGK